MERVKVSQDVLYQFLTEHGIKLVRLAELTGLSEGSINSCFKHQLINNGVPRSFTKYSVRRLNEAIWRVADSIRGCVLRFGSEQTFTNQRGATYDPALVEPLKRVGEWMNLSALTERVLGWNRSKKDNVLVTKSSKAYGCISQADVDRVNAELLSVAGVLSSYEVVVEDGSDSDCQEEDV